MDDRAIIGAILHRNLMKIDFRERQTLLEDAHEVLRRVAEYTEPTATVQMVCNHPTHIISLQKPITDVQSQQSLPPQCDHSTFEQQLERLRQQLEDARRTPRTA